MKHKILSKNTVGKDYIIGDIHGAFSDVTKELNSLGFDYSKDRLISVGDIIDRGAESNLVTDWLKEPWFHPVLGNHELMCIDFFRGFWSTGTYIHNGGEWFINLNKERQYEIVNALSKLPLAITIECEDGTKVGVVHADCPGADWDSFTCLIESTDFNLDCREAETAVWSRSRITMRRKTKVKNVDWVVVGHTTVEEVKKLGNVIFIDTAWYTPDVGKFTVLDVNELK